MSFRANSRGQRGRGSRSRSGHGAPAFGSRDARLPPDRDLKAGLTTKSSIQLECPTITDSDADIKLANITYLSSYNWTNAKEPTIIVPGSPRLWQNKSLPYSVQRDSGISFVDQHGYRIPTTPLLPLIAAVNKRYDDGPEIPGLGMDWAGIDIITDRNNLRKLLRWINRPNNVGHEDEIDEIKDFRIDLQLAGNKTVLMNRWEKRTQESGGHGSGLNFERASTKAAIGCEASTGHHRIISYNMAGLDIIVRFEVDACLPSPSSTATGASVDDLADQLAEVALTTSPGSGNDTLSSSPPPLQVRAGGSWNVEQSSLIEVTTRSSFNAENFDWKEAFPQLWLSQTQHHFMAVHDRGVFSSMRKARLDSEGMVSLEKESQWGFKMLRKVLEEIQKVVIGYGETGRLSLVCENGALSIWERKMEDGCLPDELMRLFDV
ncbi:hypothetical protein HGRIS_005509 [Hohenbuehelia grisea]|uniref:Uncharacterized protein n=1 Tax=Hohenbuehelia grisea TaxID=104357 RepID=A0ABR3JX89_9AGAR